MNVDELRLQLRQLADAVPPAQADALSAVRRQRQRRRRVTTVAGVAPLIAALAVVGATLHMTGTPAKKAEITAGSGSLPPPQPGPTPAFYVAYPPSTTAGPGQIVVVDTATGKIIRSLGTVYQPYLANGFQLSADRSTLFYTRLDASAKGIEIVRVPVAGGPTQVVAEGTNPQLSPDGRGLAFEPAGTKGAIAVMDLGRNTTSTIPLPGTFSSQALTELSWLPGSTRLVAVGRTPSSVAEEDCVGACPSRTAPPAGEAAVLDLAAPRPSWSDLAPPRGISHGWDQVVLEGPGPRPGSVLAIAAPAGTPSSVVYSINVQSDAIDGAVTLPPEMSIVARDTTGTHFLLETGFAVTSWTPGQGPPTYLGPQVGEAAW